MTERAGILVATLAVRWTLVNKPLPISLSASFRLTVFMAPWIKPGPHRGSLEKSTEERDILQMGCMTGSLSVLMATNH